MGQDSLIRCVFNGAALEPDGNFAAAKLHDAFGAGEVVTIDLDPERSVKSHRHQFAFVKTAWDNLPESLKGAPWAITPETMRKHALIATGFCHSDMIALGDERRAERLADFLRKGDARSDTYSIVAASGPIVTRYTAETQRMKIMGKERFQESKQAILEWMADQIGVKADDLAKMGKRGAA